MDSAGRPPRGRGRLRGLPAPGATTRKPASAGPSDSHSPSRSVRPERAQPGGEPAPTALRGRFRLALIRDLAMGEWDTPSLARIHGLRHQDVEAFRITHQAEIQEVSAALSGTLDQGTAGLWLPKKQLRLAEYQQAIEDIDEALDFLRARGIPWSREHRDLFRARLDLYRQAADELGAYPQRTQAPTRQGLPVQYIIESEDTGSMT